MITVEDFVLELNDDEEKKNFKLGQVAELFENDTAKILFDGEDIPSEKQYAYLSSYVPTVGDRVLLAVTGRTYVVLGKVNFGVSPDIEIEDNKYLFDLETVNILNGLNVTGATKFNSGITVTGVASVGSLSSGAIASTGNISGAAISGNSISVTGEVKGKSLNITDSLSVSGLTSTGQVKGSTLASNGSITGSSLTVTGQVKGGSLNISSAVSFSGITCTGTLSANADLYAHSTLYAKSTFRHQGSKIGFFDKTPASRPSGNVYSTLYSGASLADVISKLNTYIELLKSYGLSA